MKKKRRTPRQPVVTRITPARAANVSKTAVKRQFDVVLSYIEAARDRACVAVNRELIDLYWRIGEYIHDRIDANGWGQGTVADLAAYIQIRHPGLRGYSASNLWRMRQFVEAWRAAPKLAPLVRELSWSHNLIILARCPAIEEREYYLRLSVRERWSRRELERGIGSALFERSVLHPPKLAPLVRESHPDADRVFKDAYFVEFLHLPDAHSEADLHTGLRSRLKDFLLELGRDFCFVGSEYPIQVGKRDFFLDLLFFNRALNCLVVFELKIDEFKPEYLGKLEFYLEALDRRMKKAHERPAIGVLLCKTRDDEIVEFALARSQSPALISEYRTRLPNKGLFRRKLQEFYESAAASAVESRAARRGAPRLSAPKKRGAVKRRRR
jgi:predicted nuclease of restriction endonuclease-like (RecB) superfamily